MRLVWRAIEVASLSFVALMVAGGIASLWLPDRNRTDFETACYWTDAMLVFVQCGDDAWLGWLREAIYNLYFTMFFPLVPIGWPYLIAGLAAWAAVIIAGVTLWRAASRRFTSAR
ncbi:MAG TPA: hypothetical protein PLL33_07750 [Paracoccus sp. (in: a-proteobacteria)]|nr:hypothetical protein [Paracoccus sp. (in: a-proteobacteria)]